VAVVPLDRTRATLAHVAVSPALAPILAHASGFSWDEALLVLTPLVVIGGLLWLANRRAARLQDGDATDDADAEGRADAGRP
jgi:cyanate permease